MKDNDSLVGGHLKDDPKVYDAYARYLVKFVQAYAAAGVPVDYLTVQNEPQNRKPSAYPGTDLPVQQEAKVIEALGPLLHKASPRTKILAYDHNWTTHPDDIATAEKLGEDPETDYPYEVLDGPAAKWIAGTAYHCYSGDPSAQSALHDAHPDKGIWFTECSGSHGATDTPAQIFRSTLTWHARTITVGTTRNWAKSVADWNLVLDADGGPHNGGCDTCSALLAVQPDGTVTTSAEYYTIGHLAKFVRPGAVRIGSTNYGTTGWNGRLTDVAFRNPDGSTALVVHNENDDPRSFAVAVGDQTFDYTLPGGALATFTWPKSTALTSRLHEVPLDGAHATAQPAGQGAAGLAIDADGSTRWSSGQGSGARSAHRDRSRQAHRLPSCRRRQRRRTRGLRPGVGGLRQRRRNHLAHRGHRYRNRPAHQRRPASHHRTPRPRDSDRHRRQLVEPGRRPPLPLTTRTIGCRLGLWHQPCRWQMGRGAGGRHIAGAGP